MLYSCIYVAPLGVKGLNEKHPTARVSQVNTFVQHYKVTCAIQTSAMYMTFTQPVTSVTIHWFPVIRRRNLVESLICHLSTIHKCDEQTKVCQ